ncbi:DUF2577 family protein [Paenibacillus sp. NPDC093718]|uniref:DUF2577 family protein n=1 Tax=Paenibacillus sp. NPDC093718 TaxID=3390601 RepID=UPI003CFFE193
MNEDILFLTKLFTDRDNPKIVTVAVGTVLQPLPDIQVQLGKSIILTREDLIISASLTEGYKGKYTDIYTTVNGLVEVEKEVIVKMELAAGDEVILIPTTDMQTYYVMNKVGG